MGSINVDAIRINLEVVPSKGHGDSLYVVGSSSNELSVIELTEGERVHWRQGSYPYTAFLRNRNLQKTPRSCRGLLCVFRTNDREQYRLGVIGNLSPLWNRTVHIYEWTGSSCASNGVYTPEFLYFANRFPVDYNTVSSDFTPVTIELRGDAVPDIMFLNIVSSHPCVDLPNKKDCVNDEDKCFEMSPRGPDIVIDPKTMPTYENVAHPVRVEWDVNVCNPLVDRNRGLCREKTPPLMFENRKGIHHLPSEVYAVVSEEVPRMEERRLKRIQSLLAVPFVDVSFLATDPVRVETYVGHGKTLRFALITREEWKELVKKGELSHEEHNAFLDEKAETVLQLRVIQLRDDRSGGIRLALANGAEMRSVEPSMGFRRVSLAGTDAYFCDNYSQPNELCPGNVVVRVLKQRKVSLICNIWNCSYTISETNTPPAECNHS